MSNSIFGIGASGLNAAQAGMVTTGHNITNASTPGFSRQEIVQASNIPLLTGAGFFGQGVQVSTVKRLYSDFLSNQVNLAQTQGSQLDSYYAEIQQIDNMLGDVSAGLSPALQDFFSGVNGVAANPASMPSRQAMLSGAQELASRFQTMDQRLTEIRSGVNGALQSSVGTINSYAKQIAALNGSIAQAEAATNMQPANDLRDQRDVLIADLGKEIRVTLVTQSDGSYNVFVGNGQPLVVGRQAFGLVTAPSAEDPQRLEVGYTSGASTVLLGSATLQGGNLGGLLAFRSETLDSTQNALGRVAIGVAQTFNNQHQMGQDLNGVLGGRFFNVASPVVLPRTGNTGTAALTASLLDVSALTTSDYRLQYNGAIGPNESFTLTRLADGVATAIAFPTATGYPASYVADGLTLTVSAGAAVNDSWEIQPTRTGASSIAVALKDPAAIAAASPVRTAAALANSGSANISSASVSSIANLPLPATVQLTYSSGTGQFTVSGAVPAAGPFAYPATVPGVAPTVTGSAPTFGASIAANAFAINGVNVGAVTAGASAIAQGANLAAAINLISASSGVTATASSTTGALTLTASGGRQIAITGTLTDTGLTAAITPGNTISFNGITFTMSGTPANGDVFTVDRNASGVADSSNAVALAGLQTANSMGKNAGVAGAQPILNFQQAYAQLVSDVGNKTRQTQVMATAQQNLVAQTRQAQQSIAGVNLDDEAANLLRYQQAYQASGKMMQIATSLFQTLLDLGR